MSKKVKVLVSVLVVVVLLTVGGVATVMAQDEPSRMLEATTKGRLATRVGPQIEFSKSFGYVGDNMTAGLLARVAEILGIPQEDLVSAFEQAQQEIREEAFIRALESAVEKGRITEEEANEIKEWWGQKPEVSGSGLFPRAFGTRGLGGGHMMGWTGRHMGGWNKGQFSDNTT